MLRKSAVAAFVLALNFAVSKAETNYKQLDFQVPQPPVPLETGLRADKSSAAKAEWTVMVFINGKNDVENGAVQYFKQLEAVGSTDRINIVAELGRKTSGTWTGCRRYLVKKDTGADIASPPLQIAEKCDMGDYNRAVDFGEWAMSKFPANHYMYIIWNHGLGWEKSGSGGMAKGISCDQETGHYISTPQMGLLLNALGHVDVYRSEACLMQMAEVAYEIKDRADYILGSEEVETEYYLNADEWLNKFIAGGDFSPEALAKTAVDVSRQFTLSCVRAAAMAHFVELLDGFSSAVMKEDKTVVATAAANTQRYATSSHRDLYHFATLVAASSKNEAVKSSAKTLTDYIAGTLVIANKTNQAFRNPVDTSGKFIMPGDYTNSHGLAIYLRESAYDYAGDTEKNYGALSFAKNSKWPEFLQWLHKK
ncbi:MAG: clostripain-related cysteine peptidase [Elusimicrobiales bacterium]|nr:clostripain-related cysteine peptidase [Elusimicrobiales bacterium]